MNVEQARKNVAIVERELEEADRNLQNHHGLVKAASEEVARLEATLGAANSLLLTAIANEPTEDKVIDMSHFIDSGLMMYFKNGHYGYLKGIDGRLYKNQRGQLSGNCQPIFNHDYASMEGWDKSPIPEGYVIRYKKFKNDFVIYYKSDYSKLDWSKVAMFRIVGIKDKFKHE